MSSTRTRLELLGYVSASSIGTFTRTLLAAPGQGALALDPRALAAHLGSNDG